MAFAKTFANAIPDKEKKKVEIKKLSELPESNPNTIFNLIFAEKTVPEEKKS